MKYNTLRELFLARGLRVREVARASGLSATAISKYLRGDFVPRPEAAEALGTALGLPWEEVRSLVKAQRLARASVRPNVHIGN